MIDIVQGSDSWFKMRCGKITASRMGDVMAKPTTASYRNYQAQLVAERMTGRWEESYKSTAMQWGIDTEPMARTTYEMLRSVLVDKTDFYIHPQIINAGASPDGLVSGGEGLLEIKCPQTSTHIQYKRKPESIVADYGDQVQWQLACTGKKWCDLMSFDPRLPEGASTMIIRVERDDARIKELEDRVIQLDKEVDEIIKELSK